MNRLLSVLVSLTTATAIAAEEPKPHTDLYGDPLPPGAVMRYGTIRLRHADADVAFLKDGKRIISCGYDGETRIWDVATGKQSKSKRLFPSEMSSTIVASALSRGGEIYSVWDGKTVYFYDTNTGKERGRITPVEMPRRFLIVTFSPDGKLLGLQRPGEGSSYQVEIWNVSDFKKLQTIIVPLELKLSSLVFRWDGKQLAGMAEKDDGTGKLGGVLFDLFLWDAASGKRIGTRNNLRRVDPDSLAFSPDGKTLTLWDGAKVELQLLDAETLKPKSSIKRPWTIRFDFVVESAFSPNGRYLATVVGLRNRNIRSAVVLWDLADSNKTQLLATEGPRVAFSSDSNRLICHDEGGEIRLFDTASGRLLHPRPGHTCGELALALSPDGKLMASGDRNGILHLWDSTTSKRLRTMETPELDITACLFSPDGKRVVAIGKTGDSGSMVVGPPERIVSQVWNVADGKALRRIETEGFGVAPYAVALSADGKRLAMVLPCDNDPPEQLVVWDLTTGKRTLQRSYKLEDRVDPTDKNGKLRMAHAAFAPDGERLTVWRGDRVGIAEVSSGCLLAKLPKGVESPVVFSPDGQFLAATIRKPSENDPLFNEIKGLSLIEVSSGQEVHRLPFEAMGLASLTFTKDGRGLLAAFLPSSVDNHGMLESPKLRVWDTVTGALRQEREWPENIASRYNDSRSLSLLALPGCGVATAMKEGDILVWDWGLSPKQAHKPERDLGRAELETVWSDLSADAHKAYRAVETMTSAPAQTLPFFRGRLRPATAKDPVIDKLIVDLESDSFEKRQASTRNLTRLHYRAEPMLRRVLRDKPSLEMRRRIEAILTEPRIPKAEDLRNLRAITVLERIGTPEARRILEKLAGGADAPETRAAKAALVRLQHRSPSATGRTSP